MDREVDEMSKAYKSLSDSIAAYLWAMQISCGQPAAFTNDALEEFRHRCELFKAACDRADDYVTTTKNRLAAEYLDWAADLVEAQDATVEPSPGNAGDDLAGGAKKSPGESEGSKTEDSSPDVGH